MNNCYKNTIPSIGFIIFLILVLIYLVISYATNDIRSVFASPFYIMAIIFISVLIIVDGKITINKIKECKKQYEQDKIDVIKSINNIVVPQEIVEEDIGKYLATQISEITNNSIDKLKILQEYFYNRKKEIAMESKLDEYSTQIKEIEPYIKEINKLIIKNN